MSERRPARWVEPAPLGPELGEFAQAAGTGLPAARVLWSRGYTTESAARAFLFPQISHLHNPFLLSGMHEAVERLARAVADREKVLLYGDYDVDGTISVVILKKSLEFAGLGAEYHIPHRLRDGYGMRSDVIDRAAEQGVKLVISVDTGIRAGDVVGHAREKGIDVIVTDHHLPESELPPALAVINPNRPDCTYPEKNLCGAGVALKLVQALLVRLGWVQPRVERMLLSLLKLVALATVADVVPLVGENRVIVKLGLHGFDAVRNAGLRALLDVSGIADGSRPSSGQVAFQLAPRMNAAGRMANADDVVRMFLTEDAAEAGRIAAQLNTLNQERQATEAEIVRQILEECERVPVSDSEAALVFSGPGWHKGVVGIVASRLVDRFHRPAFVLSEDPQSGLAQGSARSVAGFHLLAALESMPELFAKFGGHKQAAGLTISAGRIPEFRQRISSYAGTLLSPEDFCPAIEIDAELALSELNERSAEELLALEPFGYGNPEPLFIARGAEICGPARPLGERGFLVPIRQGSRTMILKTWNFQDRTADLVPGRTIDAALCVQNDEYSRKRGYPGWCALIKDMRGACFHTMGA